MGSGPALLAEPPWIPTLAAARRKLFSSGDTSCRGTGWHALSVEQFCSDSGMRFHYAVVADEQVNPSKQ
jgi:hypothetical protein